MAISVYIFVALSVEKINIIKKNVACMSIRLTIKLLKCLGNTKKKIWEL
jgi:hypothetical protein